jgi:hypothetical protein
VKISEIRDTYLKSSDGVSERVRQLAFAGIAVIWIFRVGEKSGGITYSREMLWPLGLFVASLACDLLHYLYKTLVAGYLNSHYYAKYGDNDKDVFVSPRWGLGAEFFFWMKTLLVIVGYGFLLRLVISGLLRSP